MILRLDSIKETFVEHISGFRHSFECLQWKDDSRVLLRSSRRDGQQPTACVLEWNIACCRELCRAGSDCFSLQWSVEVTHWALMGEQEPYRIQAERKAFQEDGDGNVWLSFAFLGTLILFPGGWDTFWRLWWDDPGILGWTWTSEPERRSSWFLQGVNMV